MCNMMRFPGWSFRSCQQRITAQDKDNEMRCYFSINSMWVCCLFSWYKIFAILRCAPFALSELRPHSSPQVPRVSNFFFSALDVVQHFFLLLAVVLLSECVLEFIFNFNFRFCAVWCTLECTNSRSLERDCECLWVCASDGSLRRIMDKAWLRSAHCIPSSLKAQTPSRTHSYTYKHRQTHSAYCSLSHRNTWHLLRNATQKPQTTHHLMIKNESKINEESHSASARAFSQPTKWPPWVHPFVSLLQMGGSITSGWNVH